MKNQPSFFLNNDFADKVEIEKVYYYYRLSIYKSENYDYFCAYLALLYYNCMFTLEMLL